MNTKLSETQISVIIAKYEEIVRHNTDEKWNAIAQVAADTDGEVIYEVCYTAYDLGFTELSDADRDALSDAVDVLKNRFSTEVAR